MTDPCETMIDHVSKFMKACDHKHQDQDTWELYWVLCGEELQELMAASSLNEELDAICDAIWVLIGYGLARGYDMNKAWAEVARSNMAKIHEDGTVKRREDGKILKPEGWTPPNLHGCFPK